MKPFVECGVPEDEVNRLTVDYLKAYRQGDKLMVDTFGENNPNIKEAIRDAVLSTFEGQRLYRNDIYQVAVREHDGGTVHLSIRRIDRVECHDWRDFQEIKNIFIGPECEAIELYPAESRVVDTANQYHLWGVKDPTFRFPGGFSPVKTMRYESEIADSKQRPFEKDENQEA